MKEIPPCEDCISLAICKIKYTELKRSFSVLDYYKIEYFRLLDIRISFGKRCKLFKNYISEDSTLNRSNVETKNFIDLMEALL